MALACLGLAGCAPGVAPLVDAGAEIWRHAWGGSPAAADTAALNPAYRYLRAEVQGNPPALLVLGYVDPHPQGAVEVWYSAQGEVLQLQQGRVVGASGLAVGWKAVRLAGAPGALTRTRDEMPGYRFGVVEQLQQTPWGAGVPPIALPASLPAAVAGRYTWYSETAQGAALPPLPPAWFAWGLHRGEPAVVYSQQCLSPAFCLKLQLWPVQEQALP